MSIDDAFSAPGRGARGDSEFRGNDLIVIYPGGSAQDSERFQQGCCEHYRGNGGAGFDSMATAPLLQEAQDLRIALRTGDMQTVLKIGDDVDSRDIIAAQDAIWQQMDQAQTPDELGSLVREESDLRQLRKASIASDLMMDGDKRHAMMMLRGLAHDELMLGQIRDDMGLNRGYTPNGFLAGKGESYVTGDEEAYAAGSGAYDPHRQAQADQRYASNPMDYVTEPFGDEILAQRDGETDALVDNARNAIAENNYVNQNAMVENNYLDENAMVDSGKGSDLQQQASYMQFNDGGADPNGVLIEDPNRVLTEDPNELVAQDQTLSQGDPNAIVAQSYESQETLLPQSDPNAVVMQTDPNIDQQTAAA